jgi:hypothetical protein
MSRQTKPSASGRDRVEALSFANAEKWQKQWSCDSNLMRLRWIPIILAIGFTLSILGGGNFFLRIELTESLRSVFRSSA